MASVPFLALWREGFWGPFEPRDIEIAREQFASGQPLRVPTFAGMPFLEKPPLFYALVAFGFAVAAGPSVMAARLVNSLLLLVWIAAVSRTARRAAGSGAGLLAGGLLAATGLFVAHARRVTVDSALAASTALALMFLAQATSRRGPIPLRPWLLGLGCAGLAFFSKGPFGSFLVLAPLCVFALWTRDGRIHRALLRPASILVLSAPVSIWAAVLYEAGGTTFVFEAFVNNSLGRALSVRFDVAGVANLPYGDVNSPQVWWYYAKRLPSLFGPGLLLLPFVAAGLFRGRLRERGPRTRTAALGFCFALVPIFLLSFSSQKGVHHLGSCTSGFALATALWADRRMQQLDHPRPPAWLRYAAAAVVSLAPLALGASLLGQPSDRVGVVAAIVVAALAGTLVAVVALKHAAWRIAGHSILGAVMAILVVANSLGNADADDLHFLDFPRWLASEVGSREVALLAGGDSDLAAFSWALRRNVVRLHHPGDLRAFFDSEEPRLCVVRDMRTEQILEDPPGWASFATGGNGARTYTVLANAAAATELTEPRSPPPFAR